MNTNSFLSTDGTMLTQQSFGISAEIKSNEQNRSNTSKLMIENDIKLYTDYLISAIKSSKVTETLEGIVKQIRGMHAAEA